MCSNLEENAGASPPQNTWLWKNAPASEVSFSRESCMLWRAAYPDLMIVCNGPKLYANRDDTVTDANIIIEVLSPSIESYDRGPKSGYYRALPSLQQILLVEQARTAIYSLEHREEKWLLPDLPIQSGSVELAQLGLYLPLLEIYRGLKL